MKHVRQFKSWIFACAFLFINGSAYSNYFYPADPIPGFQQPYEGRIVVTNTSKELIEVSLHGNHCQVLKADNTLLRSCQSTFLRTNEQFTFFLNAQNVKGSDYLWLEMKYPNAMLAGQTWFCHDKDTHKRVDGKEERLATQGYSTVDIRSTSFVSTKSVSCLLTYNPLAL